MPMARQRGGFVLSALPQCLRTQRMFARSGKLLAAEGRSVASLHDGVATNVGSAEEVEDLGGARAQGDCEGAGHYGWGPARRWRAPTMG